MAGAVFVPYYAHDGCDHLIKLIRDEGVTGFWDLNDSVAFETMQQLKEGGLRIPDDVSLVARNDTPWAHAAVPALTTVSLNPKGIGVAVADAVGDALAGRAPDHGPYVVQPHLVVRDSTGPAPGATEMNCSTPAEA